MTSLTRWRPRRNLLDIHRGMDRVFDDIFRPFEDFFSPARYREWNNRDWLPAVDVLEADDHVEIRAEVPGLSEKDVHVSVTDNVLTLKGEKTQETSENGENYHRVERSYGSFQRSFTLPRNLQAENTVASFKNGVLTVSIPKVEEVKPKEIQISVE